MTASPNNSSASLGKDNYLNKHCWLARNLGHSPYDRCQYCNAKFRECIFLHYQIISIVLTVCIIILLFLVDGKISPLMLVSIFTIIIVDGYFFSKSTDKIIEANFIQRKTVEALQDLSKNLEDKVAEQTKEINDAYRNIAIAYATEKQTNETLKNLDNIKTQFMLATQHHLRTPLTIIQGYLSMIEDGDYGNADKEILEKVHISLQETKKLIKVVDDLLDIAKYQMNTQVSEKQITDVAAVLNDVLNDLREKAEKKGLTIEYVDQISLPPVAINTKAFREAIYNIIDNGIKYTQQGGITIKTIIDKDVIRISIADTGIGMSEVDRLGLFKRIFERGDNAKKYIPLEKVLDYILPGS